MGVVADDWAELGNCSRGPGEDGGRAGRGLAGKFDRTPSAVGKEDVNAKTAAQAEGPGPVRERKALKQQEGCLEMLSEDDGKRRRLIHANLGQPPATFWGRGPALCPADTRRELEGSVAFLR